MTISLYRRVSRELGLEIQSTGRAITILGSDKVFRIAGNATDYDTYPAGLLAGDKVYTRKVLEEQGVIIPLGQSFPRDLPRDGLRYALSLARPCVVKPARDTSSGQGVTVAITAPGDLQRAFHFASLFCDEILIEEFIPGDSYRFLIFKGKCLSVIRREFPRVEANGIDNVRHLILEENATRIKRTEWKEGDAERMPLRLDRRARRTLSKQRLNLDTVPEKGRIIIISEPANFGTGGTFTEHYSAANPLIIRAAEKAALAMNLDLAGVDVICRDLSDVSYCVNEINTTSSLHMHYFIENQLACRDPIRTILCDFFRIRTGCEGMR
jgi:cyanophycin synthetase